MKILCDSDSVLDLRAMGPAKVTILSAGEILVQSVADGEPDPQDARRDETSQVARDAHTSQVSQKPEVAKERESTRKSTPVPGKERTRKWREKLKTKQVVTRDGPVTKRDEVVTRCDEPVTKRDVTRHRPDEWLNECMSDINNIINLNKTTRTTNQSAEEKAPKMTSVTKSVKLSVGPVKSSRRSKKATVAEDMERGQVFLPLALPVDSDAKLNTPAIRQKWREYVTWRQREGKAYRLECGLFQELLHQMSETFDAFGEAGVVSLIDYARVAKRVARWHTPPELRAPEVEDPPEVKPWEKCKKFAEEVLHCALYDHTGEPHQNWMEDNPEEAKRYLEFKAKAYGNG